jgi:hypothetical protein
MERLQRRQLKEWVQQQVSERKTRRNQERSDQQ